MVRNTAVLFALCIITAIIGCKTQSLTNKKSKDSIDIQPGTQLNYNLAYSGERYQFIVDLLEVNPQRRFRYTMTGRNNYSSVITLTKSSLDTASVLVNTFSGGDETFESSASTVWFSRRMFAQLMENDSAEFNGNKTGFALSKTVYRKQGIGTYTYEYNGVPKEVEIVKVKEDSDRGYYFWVLNDPDNPLIIKMDVGFEIWLKEVNSN